MVVVALLRGFFFYWQNWHIFLERLRRNENQRKEERSCCMSNNGIGFVYAPKKMENPLK